MEEWHYRLASNYANLPGFALGIAFGYLFYKQKKFFTSQLRVYLWWTISFGFPLGIIIIPSFWIYDRQFQNVAWISALFVPTAKVIFTLGYGVAVLGMSEGIGGPVKKFFESNILYILGKLSFSAFLLHAAFIVVRGSQIRANVYLTEYLLICDLVCDVTMTIIGSLFLTLLVEMPFAGLMKIMTGPMMSPDKKDEARNEKDEARSEKDEGQIEKNKMQ